MKKFLVFMAVIVVSFVTITLCLKSCQSEPKGLLNLLPSSEPATITPDKVAIVKEIQKLSRLETAAITFQQIFNAERSQETLWGTFGEKLTFVAYGQVTAGIDLSKLNEGDIEVIDDKTLRINLPDSEIFNAILDNDKSYVADRKSGFLAYIDPQLETEVRRTAQEYLLQNALNSAILETADQNAQLVITEFLQSLGFEKIEYLYFDPDVKMLDLVPHDK